MKSFATVAVLAASLAWFAGCAPAEASRPRDLRAALPRMEIVVDGAIFKMPGWFTPADEATFRAAAMAYIEDARDALRGYRAALPVLVHLDDTITGAGSEAATFDPATRTAHLVWPRGAKGRPLAVKPMPRLAWVMVQDRRRELGVPASAPLAALEADAMIRGQTLDVRLDPADPSAFDFVTQPPRP